jgi:hypothetical protein
MFLTAVGALALPANVGLSQPTPQNHTESVVASWYVDSAHGKDTNSGEDSNHPFQTIGRLLASKITSGQTIALKAGSHWRETLTVPAANVTVTSYGRGQKPLLDASDVVSSTLWSRIPGTKYVYGVVVPIDADPNITWVNVWENGSFLIRASSIANCDATPGSYYPSTDTGNGTIPITLYIHTSDGSNPGMNGRLYEYSKRQEALDTGSYPNVNIIGLWLRRNLSAHGSLGMGGVGSLADQLLISDGSKHNAYICPGVSMTDVELRDQYYGGQDFFLLVINGNGMPGDTTLTRVHAHNAVPTLVGDGIGSHTNDGNPFTGTLTCVDCEVDNTQRGFDPGGWDHVVFVRPITSGTQSGIDVLGNISTSVTDGNIVALNGRGINDGGSFNSTLVIQGTTITSTGGSAILVRADSTTITSSTISTDDGASGPIYLTGGNFKLTGNTVNRGPTSTQPFYIVPTGVSGTSDYNTFLSNATSGTPFWLGAGQYSFKQLQGLGFDLHSTTP